MVGWRPGKVDPVRFIDPGYWASPHGTVRSAVADKNEVYSLLVASQSRHLPP
jgi:hypothetical protein